MTSNETMTDAERDQAFMRALADTQNSLGSVPAFEKDVPPTAPGIFTCNLNRLIKKAGTSKDKQGVERPSLVVGLAFKVCEGPDSGSSLTIWYDLLRTSTKGDRIDASKFRGVLARVVGQDILSTNEWVQVGLTALQQYIDSQEKFEVEWKKTPNKNRRNSSDKEFFDNYDVLRLLPSA